MAVKNIQAVCLSMEACVRNVERAAQTRDRLTAAARALFADQGFAATSTEAVIARSGMTRGALYHHFAEKAELFEAVCRELSLEAKAAIELAVKGIEDPLTGLEAGSLAWVDYMLAPEARRILLVEAPTVLGWQRWRRLDEKHSFQLLRAGIGEAMAAGAVHFEAGAEALAILLNGAMNALVLQLGPGASALDIAAGRDAVRHLLQAFASR